MRRMGALACLAVVAGLLVACNDQGTSIRVTSDGTWLGTGEGSGVSKMVMSNVWEQSPHHRVLTIKNGGSSTLKVSGLSFSNNRSTLFNANGGTSAGPTSQLFHAVPSTSLPASLSPGSSMTVTLTFDPPRRSPSTRVELEGWSTMTIQSNDASLPGYGVNLSGIDSSGWEGSYEPRLQQIFDVMGFSSTSGSTVTGTNAGGSLVSNWVGGTKYPVGDEVVSPYLKSANGGPVTVLTIARYSAKNPGTFGWFNKGATPGSNSSTHNVFTFSTPPGPFATLTNPSDPTSPVINGLCGPAPTPSQPCNYHPSDQLVMPAANSAPGIGFTINPGSSSFGYYIHVDGLYQTSDDKLNNASGFSQVHSWRLYRVRNLNGSIVPNTYIGALDLAFNPEWKNYDFNDDVFLFRNVIPG